jgi:hypothetical protein
VNENKPADNAHAPRRRRVIRGAISAPVVLTISSGAGAQMTSSLRCVANQVQNPTTLPREVLSGGSVPSTVVRVQLRQVGSIFYVAGADLIALQQASRPIGWIGVGEYRQFNLTSNTWQGPPKTTLPSIPPLSNPARFAVLQMDQQGFIMSVGKSTGSTTSMVAATCWNSFRLAP